MNREYLFDVLAESRESNERVRIRLIASGSQETRARRRVLHALYHFGFDARRLYLLSERTPKE